MVLEHRPVISSGKAAPGPDPRIKHRIQIGMFPPIRVDHTNCLKVSIKTHSFIDRSLNETAVDKIRKYRADYYNNPPSVVSFMSPIASTSVSSNNN